MKKYPVQNFAKVITKTKLVFISLFLFTQMSSAYLSLSETAELIKENQYRVGVSPQLLVSDGGGSNISVFFDLPVESDMNARFILGSGATEFWAATSIKWVPYPDYKTQPAIGLRAAFIYARESKDNFYALQLTPIISKIVDTHWGKMNPYIGIPVTALFSNTKNLTALQFVVGSEWIDRRDFQLGAEFDFNLSKSVSAITLHANFPFDGKLGFRQ